MSTTTEVNAYEIEVREILGRLQQSERDVIASWLAKNHRLETEGPKGFSNVSIVVAWLLNRKYPITEANLTTALGNSQTNGHRKIFWKELPKQSRDYVGGKPNHAHAAQKEAMKSSAGESEFYPDGRRNHNYTAPSTITEKSAEPHDAWQQIIDIHMKEWSTHGQKLRLENELSVGLAAGKSRREIAMALGAIVREQRRGR